MFRVEKSSFEDKKGNSYCAYIVLENDLPMAAINDTLIVRQRNRLKLQNTEAYCTANFLNYLAARNIYYNTATLNDIASFLASIYEKDSNSTTNSYCMTLAAIYSDLLLRGIAIDDSIKFDKTNILVRNSKQKHQLTMIPYLMSMFNSRKNRNSEVKYSKWYTKDQMVAIAKELRLDYRCLFLVCYYTGYRFSSAAEITMTGFDSIAHTVYPGDNMSKTGRTHMAKIPRFLADMINTYIVEMRSTIISSTGSDCANLFLSKKGEAVKYTAYRSALIAAADRALRDNPELNFDKVRTHACRSSFLAALRDQQIKDRREGNRTLSDTDIMALMDWKSMSSITNYDRTTRAQEASELINDFLENEADFFGEQTTS